MKKMLFAFLAPLLLSPQLLSQNVNGLSITGPAPWIDVTAYGAKADSTYISSSPGCSTNISGSQLTCSGITFLTTDIGKAISIYGAGSPDFFTTIASILSASTVLLTHSATGNVSNKAARYSTENTVPIQNAINAAKATGSTIYFPYSGTGNYYIGNPGGVPTGLTITPVSGANAPGLKLVGECSEPADPGSLIVPSNCSTILTDQAILMLSCSAPSKTRQAGPG